MSNLVILAHFSQFTNLSHSFLLALFFSHCSKSRTEAEGTSLKGSVKLEGQTNNGRREKYLLFFFLVMQVKNLLDSKGGVV